MADASNGGDYKAGIGVVGDQLSGEDVRLVCYNNNMPLKFPPELLTTIRRYQPQKAILFGSQAKGSQDEASDIDLILIKSTSKPFLERLKEFALLLPGVLPRVDAFIYTPDEFKRMTEWENPLIMKALEEGQVIYEASA